MYGNHHSSSGFPSSPDLASGGYPYFSGHHHHHHHMSMTPHPHPHLIAQPQSGYQAQIPSSNATTTTNASTLPTASESSNVLYSSAGNSTAHPHLYSPTAIEYGITTSSNNSPNEQYYESGDVQGYYNTSGGNGNGNNNGSVSSPGAQLPENHIISSDNGLSYTNLDYIAYQQSQGYMVHGGPDDKSHIPHHYNEDIMIPGGQTPLHTHHSNTPTWHHHSHGYDQHQLNLSTIPPSSLQAQPMNHGLHSPSGIQSAQSSSPNLTSQQHQNQSQQQQQNVPTYKWMQVKRNVPKPQSEFHFLY